MRTQMLGTLEIDGERLSEDLERSSRFDFAQQYAEFSCGRPWKGCMLWSSGGGVGDDILTHYDTSKRSRPTVYGEQLPYLRRVVERYFAVEHLRFLRMAVMSDNVLVPHRDFVEFADKPAEDRVTHRLHVPLVTSEDCLFMEENVVYRMLFAEVWFLDVTKMHSAAVLSGTQRVHLILDFADVPDGTELLKFDVTTSPGIPLCNRIERPPLSAQEREAGRALAGLVDDDNLIEIFGILSKKQFRKDGGDNYVWDTMEEISEGNGDPCLRQRIQELYRHYMLTRDE